MSKRTPLDLGRRERQIMEAVYAHGQASVSDVLAALPDPPSYSAVRAILNTLERKGHLRRKKTGKKYLYLATAPRNKVGRSALKSLLATFFDGSAVQAMASLIEMDEDSLSDADLERLLEMIEAAKKDGR